MKALPQSLIPLHLADGTEPGAEIHPLADRLRQALANPDKTDISSFAKIVEALHAELNMARSEFVDMDTPAEGESTGEAPTSPDHLCDAMDADDEPGEPLPV